MDFASGAEKLFIYGGLKCPWEQKGEFFVHEHGVAFAALSKVVSDRKIIKYLDTVSNNANGVLITDKNNKRTAVLWSVNDNEVPVSLFVGDSRAFKGMDMFGNPLSFEAKNNLLTMKLTQELVYIFDVDENIRGIELAKIKGASLINSENVYNGELIITNPKKDTLKIEIKTTLPKGFEINIQKETTIPAEKTISIPFELKLKDVKNGKYSIVYELITNKEVFAKVETEYLVSSIKQLNKGKSIILDGNFNDWNDIPEEKVSKLDNVVIGLPNTAFLPYWMNENDLSATVKTAWLNDGIYFMMDVVDDMLYLPTTDKEKENPWSYDCVEIFIDASNTGNKTKIMQFCITPSITEKVSKCAIKFINVEPITSKGQTRFFGRKTEKGYVIEGRIVPESNSELKLASGRIIGIDIAIDDRDDKPANERKTQMVLFGSENNSKDSSKYGRFKLLE